ncbi:hypothetical protein HYALB_00001548 [Hymenoscyphus albidus]|uniref:Uncharacterized protein n=1 Tax=Hymenoscyphus albidus TaxID=595503 RepID=A0A9N9LAT6_9HELO|nr:hypothetical protein HYALB_00001548 [Hymenoscyphus albidus]
MDILDIISRRSKSQREKIEREWLTAAELLKKCLDKKLEVLDIVEASCKGDLQSRVLNKEIESLKVSCRETQNKLQNYEIKASNDWLDYRARCEELQISYARNMQEVSMEERLHWQNKPTAKQRSSLWTKAERDYAYSELRSLLENISPSPEPREASKAVELAEKLKTVVEELKMALEAEKSGRPNDQQEYESMLEVYRKLPVSQHLQVSRELLLESAQAHLSTSEDKHFKITHEQPRLAISPPLQKQVPGKRTHLDDEIANRGNPEILETRTRKRPPVSYKEFHAQDELF